eukprot:401450_1
MTCCHNGTFLYNIQSELLQRMSDVPIGKAVAFAEFEIRNTKWRLIIYPNGRTQRFSGYFQAELQLTSLPTACKEIIICMTIKCLQTESSSTIIATQTINDMNGWSFALHSSELLKNKYNKLDFMVHVKILQINAANNIYYQYKFQYPKTSKLKYAMNKNMINKFIDCKPGKVIEYQASDMWCIRVMPNGDIPERAGCFIISLQLKLFPANVVQISVAINIWCSLLDEKSFEYRFSKEYNRIGITLASGTFDEFIKLKEFKVSANLMIVHEYSKFPTDVEKYELKHEPASNYRGFNNVNAVKYWLGNEVKLEQYFDLFTKNGYNVLNKIVDNITMRELEKIGIKQRSHRKIIMLFVNKLKNKNKFEDNTEKGKTICGWILCSRKRYEFVKKSKCKGCKLIRYCSKTHQKKHWNYIHRMCCGK